MPSYIILGSEDLSFVRAFRVRNDQYRPSRIKNQLVQRTVTGDLDVQVSAMDRMWQYGLKVYDTETDSVTPSSFSEQLPATAYAVSGAGWTWLAPGNSIVRGSFTGNAPTSHPYDSQQLEQREYGFSIPTSATVDSITMRMRYIMGTGLSGNIGAQLVLAASVGGTVSTSQVADTASVVDLGADLWGESVITPSQINSTNFGFNLTLSTTGTAASLDIDYIDAVVEYSFFGSTVPYGTMDDLIQLFEYNVPGENKLWFQDLDESVHRVLLTQRMSEHNEVIKAGGIASRYTVPVQIMQWEEVT